MKISQLPPKLKELALANMSEPDEEKTFLEAFNWVKSKERSFFWDAIFFLSQQNKLANLYPNNFELGEVIRQLSNQ